MRFGKYGKIVHIDNVVLGTGSITRFTLFEIKYLFGIIINIFNTKQQDRYHTHAFNSISIMLKGYYNENVLSKDGNVVLRTITPGLRFIPKTLNHQILESSTNAVSVTFMGPWEKVWTETDIFKRKVRYYTWGRVKI